MHDKAQHSRFELKYWISEEQSLRVRDFVSCHLQLDEFAVGQPTWSYPTLSLYLDSPGLDLYRDTLNGSMNRYKLRLRYYDDKPRSPVFFEVKRRLNSIIIKRRAGVRKTAVRELLSGQFPLRDYLLDENDEEAFGDLQEFCRLQILNEARPTLYVGYMREAWENPLDNSVRVTMDRAVYSAPNRGGELMAHSEQSLPVFGSTVILELKFTNRYPNWFNELVSRFNCVQTGAAKYAFNIEKHGEDWAQGRVKEADHVLEQFLAHHEWLRSVEPKPPAKTGP
jgi:hypothetical protein